MRPPTCLSLRSLNSPSSGDSQDRLCSQRHDCSTMGRPSASVPPRRDSGARGAGALQVDALRLARDARRTVRTVGRGDVHRCAIEPVLVRRRHGRARASPGALQGGSLLGARGSRQTRALSVLGTSQHCLCRCPSGRILWISRRRRARGLRPSLSRWPGHRSGVLESLSPLLVTALESDPDRANQALTLIGE